MPRTDFNGDGRDDLILRNTDTGAVTNWLGQSDGSFVYNDDAGLDPYAIGTLVSIGDFNADGRSDTLWRTDTGALYLSETFEGGAFYFVWSLGFVSTISSDWVVSATGDFNGDGRDDILWRSSSTGVVTDWLSQGNGTFSHNDSNTGQAIPTDWQIVGTGDFNGDGRDDIVWRSSNGTVTNWLGQVNGGFVNNHVNTGQVIPIDWHIVGTGDFNGDGIDDLLWRSDGGIVTNWLGRTDGGFVNNHTNTGQIIPMSWQIAATGDYDGDGRDDILWRSDRGVITSWMGQDNGGFADNPVGAYYDFGLSWQVQPHPAGLGLWDY